MALSGTKYGSCTGSAGDKYNIWIDWVVNSQNIPGNYSNITLTLKLQRNDGSNAGAYNLSAVNDVSLSADSEMRIQTRIPIDTRNKQIATLATWTGNVPHSTDGTLTLEFYGNFIMSGTSLSGGTVTGAEAVNAIPRTPPNVWLSVSGITATSARLNGSANVACNLWEYSLNSGATWTAYSTTNATSASITFTTLSAGTTYQAKIRARRSDTGVTGVSTTATITTPNITTIGGYVSITADAPTVQIPLLLTCASSAYTHELSIVNAGTLATIVTISDFAVPAGTHYTTLTLSSVQRSTLLNHMSDKKSVPLQLRLTTYSGAALGSSYGNGAATVYETTSAPTFAGFTYADTNPATVAITGNDQKLIQNHSTATVVCTPATAKNGATIKDYTVTLGGTTKTGGTTISGVTVGQAGGLVMVVTATDSRGFTAIQSIGVDVSAYTSPVISSVSARRVNGVDAEIILTLSGKYGNIKVDGVEKNALQVLRARTKKTSDTAWGGWVNLLPNATVTGNDFSYNLGGAISVNPDYSYNLQIVAQDKLGASTEYVSDLVIPQGVPLMTWRRKRVGVNQPNPQAALDVVGGFILDGVPQSSGKVTHIQRFDDGTGDNVNMDLSAGDYAVKCTSGGFGDEYYLSLATLPAGRVSGAIYIYEPRGTIYIANSTGKPINGTTSSLSISTGAASIIIVRFLPIESGYKMVVQKI